MDRKAILVPVLSLVVTWIGFRIFGFFGFLLILGIGVAAWYLLKKNPQAMDRARQNFATATAPRPRQPRPPREKPLNRRERADFDALVEGFHGDAAGGPSTGGPSRAWGPDPSTDNWTAWGGGHGGGSSYDGGSSSGGGGYSSDSGGSGGGGAD